jgi:hypothetical protein
MIFFSSNPQLCVVGLVGSLNQLIMEFSDNYVFNSEYLAEITLDFRITVIFGNLIDIWKVLL